jgi:hypothetical protein
MKSGTQNFSPGDPASEGGYGHFCMENDTDDTGPAAKSSNQASNRSEKSKKRIAPSEHARARYSLMTCIEETLQSTKRIT